MGFPSLLSSHYIPTEFLIIIPVSLGAKKKASAQCTVGDVLPLIVREGDALGGHLEVDDSGTGQWLGRQRLADGFGNGLGACQGLHLHRVNVQNVACWEQKRMRKKKKKERKKKDIEKWTEWITHITWYTEMVKSEHIYAQNSLQGHKAHCTKKSGLEEVV